MKLDVITSHAVKVANSLLMVDGRYCEIVTPPVPGKQGVWTFVKRDPVTRELFRVSFTQEKIQ